MRQQDVFQGGEGRDELEGLEDEAQFSAAHFGQLVFGQTAYLDAVDQDLAFGGGVEAGQESQQGAFAASRGTHDGHELAGRDQEINFLEDLDGSVAVSD